MRNLRAANLSCLRRPPGRIESTVTLRPTKSTIPKRNARNQLRTKVSRHLREVVHVALNIVGRMLDGEGPVLLRARSHEHAPVALEEPAQVRERLVDLEVVAVVAHPLGAVGSPAAGRERDRMERKLVFGD